MVPPNGKFCNFDLTCQIPAADWHFLGVSRNPKFDTRGFSTLEMRPRHHIQYYIPKKRTKKVRLARSHLARLAALRGCEYIESHFRFLPFQKFVCAEAGEPR